MARFKKGSKEAKAWGRRMARLRGPAKKTTSSTTKLKNTRTMAKRRYTGKAKRKTSKKGFSIMGISMNAALASMIYGAIRGKTSNYLAPYTSKIPLGNISDEVGLIATSYIGKKYLFKSAGVMRDALSTGQKIELARIGEAVMSGNVGIPLLNMGSPATATSNTNIF